MRLRFGDGELRIATTISPIYRAAPGSVFGPSPPPLVAGDVGAGATPRCRCLLDGISGLNQTQYEQGLQLCLANPAAFAAQVAAAGITVSCSDASASGAGSSSTPWFRTTTGMVGIGLGAVALLGLGAMVLR